MEEIKHGVSGKFYSLITWFPGSKELRPEQRLTFRPPLPHSFLCSSLPNAQGHPYLSTWTYCPALSLAQHIITRLKWKLPRSPLYSLRDTLNKHLEGRDRFRRGSHGTFSPAQYSARNSKKKSPSSQNHHKLGKVKDSLSIYEPPNCEQLHSTSQASEPGIKLVGVTQDWEGIYGKDRGRQEVKFSLYLLKASFIWV